MKNSKKGTKNIKERRNLKLNLHRLREVDVASDVKATREGMEEIKENQEDQMMEIQFMREENEN